MSKPLVSIIITCYNYGQYVEQSIVSALGQTYKNIELIIINDGSTDTSFKVINKYKDQARIVSRENKGIVYTRNEGLQLAKGDYICYLDADDYFDNDYIENLVKIGLSNKSDVVYPNWNVFGDNNYKTNFADFETQLLIRQEIHCTSSSLIRKKAIGNHVFESQEVAEDWDFFLGLALYGRKFKLAKDSFINYRVRKNTRGSSRAYWDDMYYFCDILQKWSKKYPEQVNPFELPIESGRYQRNEQDRIIKDKDNTINILNTNVKTINKIIKDKDNTIAQLERAISNIKSSKRYRLGSMIINPVAKLKRFIKI